MSETKHDKTLVNGNGNGNGNEVGTLPLKRGRGRPRKDPNAPAKHKIKPGESTHLNINNSKIINNPTTHAHVDMQDYDKCNHWKPWSPSNRDSYENAKKFVDGLLQEINRRNLIIKHGVKCNNYHCTKMAMRYENEAYYCETCEYNQIYWAPEQFTF